MNPRQLLLLLGSFIFVVLFFSMQGNKVWLDERILNFTNNIHDELDMTSLEDRRKYRLGSAYIGSVMIRDVVKGWNMKDPLILLPPDAYLKSHGADLSMPEPIVFYYYTGLKAVQPTNSNVSQANVAVIVDAGNVNVLELKNANSVNEVLKEYNSPGF